MVFIDWLNDICDIKTTTISEDVNWAEQSTEIDLFTGIACRLWKWTANYDKRDNNKKFHFILKYKLYVLLVNWTANKWDFVFINNDKYVIIWWQIARWWQDNHFVYILEKFDE